MTKFISMCRDAINDQKRKWEKANPSAVEMQYIKSEFLIENPKFTSIKQRKEEEIKEARKKAGLLEHITDVK